MYVHTTYVEQSHMLEIKWIPELYKKNWATTLYVEDLLLSYLLCVPEVQIDVKTMTVCEYISWIYILNYDNLINRYISLIGLFWKYENPLWGKINLLHASSQIGQVADGTQRLLQNTFDIKHCQSLIISYFSGIFAKSPWPCVEDNIEGLARCSQLDGAVVLGLGQLILITVPSLG